jgi:hypothetical protein
MSVIEIIILIVSIGAINILCFLIGAKTGQKVIKGETVELPNVNPVKAINEYKEDKRQKKEEENFNINLENIDNYDGTGLGQKDFV